MFQVVHQAVRPFSVVCPLTPLRAGISLLSEGLSNFTKAQTHLVSGHC